MLGGTRTHALSGGAFSALCGRNPVRFAVRGQWYGTGSPQERQRIVDLPKCSKCMVILKSIPSR